MTGSGCRTILADLHEPQRSPQHPHHPVAEIWIEELVRAATGDYGDPVLTALFYGGLGDARHACRQARLGAHHAVHPNVPDSEINALLDDEVGDLRLGQNEDRLRLLGYRVQVRVAWGALETRHPRIDGGDFVSGSLELAVAQIAACLALIRNPDHRDLLLSQEVLHQDVYRRHVVSFCFARRDSSGRRTNS